MADITLYRGVSSVGIEKVLTEGVHPYATKYDEARAVMSKYVNPEILTDEFLETNQDHIGEMFGKLSYRFTQFREGGGVFCTEKVDYSDEEIKKLAQKDENDTIEFTEERVKEILEMEARDALNNAISYANNAANDFPEYERYIVRFLNSLSKFKLVEFEERLETEAAKGAPEWSQKLGYQMLECRRKILENIKPEYKTEDGGVNIPKPEGKYPIVLQINGNGRNLNYAQNGELRWEGDLKPEDITGVAFAPKNADEPIQFLSKEEFLKQLEQRQAGNGKVDTKASSLKEKLLTKQKEAIVEKKANLVASASDHSP